MGYLRSLGDLVARAGRFWSVTIVGGVLGVLAAVERLLAPTPPGWEWLVDLLNMLWMPIFLGGIPLALFMAYHSLRLTEAAARDQLARADSGRRATSVQKTRTRTVVESQGLSGAAHERLALRILTDAQTTGEVVGSTIDQPPPDASEEVSA